MQSQILQYYRDYVRPLDRTMPDNPTLIQKMSAADMLTFESGLTVPEEHRMEFQNLLELRDELSALEAEQAFLGGYRVGARMMLETLGCGVNSSAPQLDI